MPEKFDTQADKLGLKLALNFDAVIAVDSNLEEGLFAGADPKRQAARAKAGQPVAEAFVKHKVRQVQVGNGLYPTAWRAKRFGMTDDDLTKTFWEGVNVDYASLATRAEEVRKALAGGNEIQIKDTNGTDLRVRIQGRPAYASDGIISAEEAQKGGAGAERVPAGRRGLRHTSCRHSRRKNRARPKEYFQGKEVQNLSLTFAGGKLTSMTGSGAGFEPLKALYHAAGEGKDLFAVVDFGINANIKLPSSSVVGTWVPVGTVTMGMGNNIWAGGNNKTTCTLTTSRSPARLLLWTANRSSKMDNSRCEC